MSRRSATAPRRYTCCTLDRGTSMSACAISRTTRGSEPGTSISVVHSSGTSPIPSSRAATAGNSERRSEVTVKTMEISCSDDSALADMTASTSSRVDASRWSRSSASSWMAPRMARTATSELHGREQLTDLGPGEHPPAALPQVAEVDRADLHAHQPLDRVADRLESPPDDVLASLVQHDLDEGLPRLGVDQPEAVDPHRPVLQLDALAQPLADVAGDRAGHLGEVGLRHGVRRVLQAVRQLSVVGQQDQALGLGVQPPDVEQPLRAVADEVAQRGTAALVAHGRHHARRLVEGHVGLLLVHLQPDA